MYRLRRIAALCHALARVPSGRTGAGVPLFQALDTLESRAVAAADAHLHFLVRELYGLARALTTETPSARLDDLMRPDN